MVLPADRWEAIAAEVRSQIHPADYWQPADLSALPTVADIADARSAASFTAVGRAKAIMLPNADQWRPEVANALLKLLEEAPEGVHLILLSGSDRLLPTVRSRVRLHTIDGGDIQEWGEVIGRLPLRGEAGRARALELLRLVPLVHPGVNRAAVAKAFSNDNSYL